MTSKPNKKISLKEAVKVWEEKNSKGENPKKIGDQIEIKFNGWIPPIEKLDNSTAAFTKCELLSISTNMIERLTNLNYIKHLKILSVGRNFLKTLSGLESCADTLEQVWASYNQIEKPTKGVLNCKKLKRIYLGNNWIREWAEIVKFNELPELEELVLVGNPLSDQFLAAGNEFTDWQHEVQKKIPQLRKIDGYNIVNSSENEDSLIPLG